MQFIPKLDKPRLRIGIMLDSCLVEAWLAKLLQDLAQAPYLEIALVITNRASRIAASSAKQPRSLKAIWPTLLYRIYSRFDRKLNKSRGIDAFAAVDVSPLLSNAPALEVMPIQKKFVDRFEAGDIGKINGAQLDVMLRFGFRVIKGEILRCARYGVWSFHHDDSRNYRGGPPLFWEIYERNPVSGTILQILSEDLDGGRILYRSFSATNFTSWYQNKNAIYWKTGNFILRRLRDLYVNGWEWIQQLDTYQENIPYNKAIYRAPRNRPMLRLLAAQGALFCRRKMELLKRDQWFLGIHDVRHAAKPLKNSRVDTIYPPRDHFYADPFLFSRDGRSFIFFEDYSHRTNRGSISCLELDTKGEYSKPITVLERDYHLSYPFLIEWESEIYMIPETYDNRTVELYRAVDFPTKWVLHKVLLDNIRAVDPTLLRHRGKFWLFINIAENEGSPANDELFLFHSASPFGPWLPHPQNPIVSDVRCARPAGRILEQDGMLVRPSQDCSTRYGHKINLNRIDVLSETEYRETKIGEVTPNWIPGNLATHTISRDNNFVVLDGCRTVSRLGPGFSSAPRFLIGRSPVGVFPLQFQLGVAREATK